MVKVLCECAALFSVGELEKECVEASGHSFIKTRFAVSGEHGIFPLYFCRCGEMALRHDETQQTMCSVTKNGEHNLTPCRLHRSSTVH